MRIACCATRESIGNFALGDAVMYRADAKSQGRTGLQSYETYVIDRIRTKLDEVFVRKVRIYGEHPKWGVEFSEERGHAPAEDFVRASSVVSLMVRRAYEAL